MATKNCPKCDSPNPVACKKCACGHVFFTTRRSANAIAAANDASDDFSEPATPQEPELPRRRTARVTRERPQFYDALQVENQTRRQRELQKRRKASRSDEAEMAVEDIPEKVVNPPSSKRRAESPPAKVAEPAPKKRRGRPPGLTNRRSGRAQILASKPNDSTKIMDGHDPNMEGELESVVRMHDVPALKALQMNMVLSDINSRISSSSVRVDLDLSAPEDAAPVKMEDDSCDEEKPQIDMKVDNAKLGTKKEAEKAMGDVEKPLVSLKSETEMVSPTKEPEKSIVSSTLANIKQEEKSTDKDIEKEEEPEPELKQSIDEPDQKGKDKAKDEPVDQSDDVIANGNDSNEEPGIGTGTVTSSKRCAFPC